MWGLKIKILLANSNKKALNDTRSFLSAEPSLDVVGCATTMSEVVVKVFSSGPDVIIVDVSLFGSGTVDEVTKIIGLFPAPTIVTANGFEEGHLILRALESGAMDFAQMPSDGVDRPRLLDELLKKIHSVSEVGMSKIRSGIALKEARIKKNIDKAVFIVAGAGGPHALLKIVPLLPEWLPVPVIVVQHMPEHYTRALAERLSALSKISVREASDLEALNGGVVYVAKGGHHARVLKKDGVKYLRLTKEPESNGERPSADVTFADASAAYGSGVLAVVLTGTGKDGSDGASFVKAEGGLVIAQDDATSMFPEMPCNVSDHELANAVLPLFRISSKIVEVVENWSLSAFYAD